MNFFPRLDFLQSIRNRLKDFWQTVAPGPRAWQGAALGVLVAVAVVLLLLVYLDLTVAAPNPYRPLELIVVAVVGIIIGGLAILFVNIFQILPTFYRWVLIAGMVILVRGFPFFYMSRSEVLIFSIIIVSSLVGAGVWVLVHGGGLKNTTLLKRLIAIGGLSFGTVVAVFGLIWLLNDGSTAGALPNAALLGESKIKPIDLPDPSLPGNYNILTLSYGSGTDRYRPEYGEEAKLITQPVNGSAFVGGWNGISGQLRTGYWGFDTEQLPLNARVWYPDGAGPFPLVLVAHGNHRMDDFSDSGYDYLGELLAGRGFIVASVDENFLNPHYNIWRRFKADLYEENDARGWLLLEHLRLWREWNETAGHIFYQKVDLNNIALVGHSRGGEAVTIAAAFNRLAHYPDNATILFDYNFNIRSVVSIAPVEGQYWPAKRAIPLENVNYFVLQGANDADIVAFEGLRQYERVCFTDDNSWFKTSLYIYGANHNQFNTTWGRKDNSTLLATLLNVRPIMSPEEQRQIAKVFISAFLEATLRGQSGYLPLFHDFRVAASWLPDTIYLQQFENSTDQFVSTYEEDINLNTTTLPEGWQNGENLTVWREQVVPLKQGMHNTSGVYLGWDSHSITDTATYNISLPTQGVTVTKDSALVFSLADAQDTQNNPHEPIDLTIELIDDAGATARLLLSSVSFLQPQIDVQLTKASFIGGFAPSEIIFQSFEFPLEDFVASNPQFDLSKPQTIRFVFDRTPAGVVVLDNVGFGTR